MKASSYLISILLFFAFFSLQTSTQGMVLVQTQKSSNLTEQTAQQNLTKEKSFKIKKVKKGAIKRHVIKKALKRAVKSTPNSKKTHDLAFLSLVFSLASFLFWATNPIMTPMLCIAAIVVGGIALKRIHQNPDKYKGEDMALVGILFGVVGVIILLHIIVPELISLGI